MKPQIFLSASHLANYHRVAAAAKGEAPSGSSSSSSIVPSAARKVLEIFVMLEQEVAAALQQAEEQQVQQQHAALGLIDKPQRSKAAAAVTFKGSNDGNEARLEQLGLDMAILTAFVRLLELKMVQMEGDEGTGDLLAFKQCRDSCY